MGNSQAIGEPGAPFFIIFTDLDGTLLDENSYKWDEAIPALDLCKRLHIPVILASSKTRAEIDLLRGELSVSTPFISENGGGIFFQDETFEHIPQAASFEQGLWRWSLGLPYARLIRGLQEIRDELTCKIRGFSDMDVKEISHLTGLDQDASRLAAMREYDEPFIIVDEQPSDKKRLIRAAEKRGLTITIGGRFYHLHGKNDKGQAMGKVVSLYKRLHKKVTTIALGDSPNDFPILKRADYPVLVLSERNFQTLSREIPGLRTTSELGPKGWNEAVLEILQT